MAASRWQRMRSGPQLWEISPTDWRFFGRSTFIGVVIAAILLLIFQSFSPRLSFWEALGFVLYGLAFGLALTWIPAVLARRELNRERTRHGMPTRPIRMGVLILVPLAILTVAFVGFSLRTDGSWSSTDNISQSVGALVGASFGILLVSGFWRGKALESPSNRAMLDREWYQLHGADETGYTIDR